MTEETSTPEVARPPILLSAEDFIVKNEDTDKAPTIEPEGLKEGEETKEEVVEDEKSELERLREENRKIKNANSRKDKNNTKMSQKLNDALTRLREFESRNHSIQEPKEEDFEGKPYGDYLKAVARHEQRLGSNEQAIDAARNEAQAIESELAEAARSAIDESGEIAEKTYPDFRKVIESQAEKSPNGKLEFSQSAWDAIQRSDDGASAIYGIVKDGKFDVLNSLPPIEAAMMVKEYEIKAQSFPKIKHVSSAPEPITSARGIASSSKDPSQMTDAEFNEWRRNSIAAKNRR